MKTLIVIGLIGCFGCGSKIGAVIHNVTDPCDIANEAYACDPSGALLQCTCSTQYTCGWEDTGVKASCPGSSTDGVRWVEFRH